MLAKRIIPCLDVHAGRVVKGVNFLNLRDAGDPVDVAARYEQEGADELVFLDITASHEERDIILDVVQRTSEVCFMPLTVGGGIRTLDDIRRLLKAGCDKVSINSAAVKDPEFVRAAALRFGSQCIVVNIDPKRVAGGQESGVRSQDVPERLRVRPRALPQKASIRDKFSEVIATPSMRDRYESYLQSKGLRLTQERAIIVDEVARSSKPFTAEQLIERLALREDGRRVSRATIYRSMVQLAEGKIIQELSRRDELSIYSLSTLDSQRSTIAWDVHINGGRVPTGLDAVEWAKEVERLGAGEIVLTSMDADGTKDGYDLEITKAVAEAVEIPVVASGGCGSPEHMREALVEGGASAALAASIFHYGEYTIGETKRYLAERGVPVRLE